MLTERDKAVLIPALNQRIPYLEAWMLEAKEAGDEKLARYWHNEYADAVMLRDRLMDGTI